MCLTIGLPSLSMPSHSSRGGAIFVVRKVEVHTQSRENGMPDIVPLRIMYDLMTPLSTCLASSSPSCRSSRTVCARSLRPSFAKRSAVVTEPCPSRYFLKTGAVCMPQLFAAITVHQHVLVIVFAACLTRLVFVFFIGDFEKHRRIEFGDLGAILNSV